MSGQGMTIEEVILRAQAPKAGDKFALPKSSAIVNVTSVGDGNVNYRASVDGVVAEWISMPVDDWRGFAGAIIEAGATAEFADAENDQLPALALVAGSAPFRVGDRVSCINLDSFSGYHGDAYVKRQINHELYEVEDVHTCRRENVLHYEMTLQHGPDEVSRLGWEAMDAARQSFDAQKQVEAAAERARIAAEKSAKAYARLRKLGKAVPMPNTENQTPPAPTCGEQSRSSQAGSARLLDTLPFDLGEYVWLAGTQSYLIKPTTPTDYSTDAWRSIWHPSQQAVQIVGIKLSCGKVWYEFPGGGNDDGSGMYRTQVEAVKRAAQQNDKIRDAGERATPPL